MNSCLARNFISQTPTTISACPPVRFLAGNKIVIDGDLQDLHFRILNAQGQEIAYHNRKNVLPGKYLFRFDVSKYQPGIYFISINLNNQNNTQKVIKQ